MARRWEDLLEQKRAAVGRAGRPVSSRRLWHYAYRPQLEKSDAAAAHLETVFGQVGAGRDHPPLRDSAGGVGGVLQVRARAFAQGVKNLGDASRAVSNKSLLI